MTYSSLRINTIFSFFWPIRQAKWLIPLALGCFTLDFKSAQFDPVRGEWEFEIKKVVLTQRLFVFSVTECFSYKLTKLTKLCIYTTFIVVLSLAIYCWNLLKIFMKWLSLYKPDGIWRSPRHSIYAYYIYRINLYVIILMVHCYYRKKAKHQGKTWRILYSPLDMLD